MSNIAEQFKGLTADVMRIPVEKVTPEAKLVDDLGLDSLDTVELVLATELEFNIEIPDDVAEKVITIQDAIDTINQALIADAR